MANTTQPISPPWGIATKSIVAVVGLVIAAWTLIYFQTLIPPLVTAAILAYLLNPLVVWLQKRTNYPRATVVLIVYLLFLLLLIGGSLWLGIVIADQINKLTDLLPRSLTEAVALLQAQADTLLARPFQFAGFNFSLGSLSDRIDLRALTQQALALIQPTLSRSGSWAALLASTTFNALTSFFLIFIFSIYVARDTPNFFRGISELANTPGYRYDIDRLIHDFVQIWNAYLRGQVILALVMGVVVSLTLALLGVTNALALGALAGVLEFLPIIGPVISAGAAILVALFQQTPSFELSSLYFALIVALVMFALQQLENTVLVPRIVGDALDLHPLLIMLSVIMGASLAGILGAVLAAPMVASLRLIGTYAWRKLLDLPPFVEAQPPPPPKPKPITRKRR